MSQSKFYKVIRAMDVLFTEPRTWCDDCEELRNLEHQAVLTPGEQERLVKLQEHCWVSWLGIDSNDSHTSLTDQRRTEEALQRGGGRSDKGKG